MDREQLLAKLEQIEEQARLTLALPRHLTEERLRFIIALARSVRARVELVSDPDREPELERVR